MAELDLDDLCNLLDDDIDDTDDVDTPEQSHDQHREPVAGRGPAVAERDEEDVSEMEEQLRLMQQQMKEMQERLERKKKSTLKEVDIFNSKASANGSAVARSPVKTNPFETYDRPVRLAKLNSDENNFGPALPKKVTRVLSGEDRIKFEQSLKERQEERSLKLVKQDLDLSDDEIRDDENPLGWRYNSYGEEISKMLNSNDRRVEPEKSKSDLGKRPIGFNSVQGSSINLTQTSSNKLLPKELLVEKHSKIRISNPELAQTTFDLSLVGRKFIPMQRLKSAIGLKETEGDWATVGIVFYKTTQTSKNGNNYTLLRMTDLLGDIQTCSVLLFGRANAKFYSLPLNRVIGLLNPKVLESRKNEVSLSIDHPDKILELGDSIDVSRCQAKKNDGTGCTNLVNKSSCEFCTYHVKKAYKSMSSTRADLQSSFSGSSDVRARLMSKIAPKGEVFGGGKILNATQPSAGRPTLKQTQRDRNTLTGLGVVTLPSLAPAKSSNKVDRLLSDTPGSRLMNDAAFFQPGSGKLTFRSHLTEAEKLAVKKVAGVSEELGLKLLNPTAGARTLMKHLTKKEDPNSAKKDDEYDRLSKKEKEARLLSQKQQEAKRLLFNQRKQDAIIKSVSLSNTSKVSSPVVPKIGRGLSDGFIDLNSPPVAKRSHASADRIQALAALRGKPISKSDPNDIRKRKRSLEDVERAQRRIAARLDESVGNARAEEEAVDDPDERYAASKRRLSTPKAKEIRSLTGEVIDAKRMQQLRKTKSANQNLADEAEIEAEEKYFEKLEKKEAMEEKMLSTREIETTVYTCKICQYTAPSQSDLCRSSLHPVKKIKAMKRFFECQNCKKRTISFDRYPKKTCTNCGGSSWARTAMMKEKKGPLLDSERLLVRGVEQKFLNSAVNSADLHLDL